MSHYDVFNGDGDGICALHQLRLAEPIGSILVTGLKRDIELLKRVPAIAGDRVTVLDVSLDRNRPALAALLESGVTVRYFDHHFAGEIPEHPLLHVHIDESAEVCTSVLVDRYLEGRHRAWAVVGAFADNQTKMAAALAKDLGLGDAEVEELRELGSNLNYNAYGESESDVLVRPDELYRIVSRYEDPLALNREEPLVARLTYERITDLRRAFKVWPSHTWPAADAYVLPDDAWSRRVRGVFADRLALTDPTRAHAVLTPLSGSGFSVSVRSPAGHRLSAAEFCRRFPKGGGRKRAAGIDRLPAEIVPSFMDAFEVAWSVEAEPPEPAHTQAMTS